MALGWPSATSGEPGLPEKPGSPAGPEPAPEVVYYVCLDQLFQAHPEWVELQRIRRDISALEEEWRGFVDSFQLISGYEEGLYSSMGAFLSAASGREDDHGGAIATSEEHGETIIARRLRQFEEDIRSDINNKVSERARELAIQVEDELFAERGIVNHEIELISKQVEREYLPRMFDLQLKLSLLDLPQSEKDKIGRELLHLEKEMKDKIAEKSKPFEEQFARVAESKRKAAEAELAQYRSTLEEEADRLVQEERIRLLGQSNIAVRSRESALDEGAARGIDEMKARLYAERERRLEAGRKDFEAARSWFEGRHKALVDQEARLACEIEADTRGLVAAYATRRGIDIAVLKAGKDLLKTAGEGDAGADSAGAGSAPGTGAGAGPGLVDMTPSVADFIRSYFGHENAGR